MSWRTDIDKAPRGERLLVTVECFDKSRMVVIGVRGRTEWVLIGSAQGLPVMAWQTQPAPHRGGR